VANRNEPTLEKEHPSGHRYHSVPRVFTKMMGGCSVLGWSNAHGAIRVHPRNPR
jgi:hypothetical protein